MTEKTRRSNFLTDIIDADIAAGRNQGKVVTRFPPEPNGYLHIGHAKSIILNFGLGQQFGGRTHLRFDDTNPTTEETEYVESIEADVRWLGFDWGKHLYFASQYFEKMYECAERLVKEGKAYVDSQTQEEIRDQRGNFDKPGTNSPFRNRSVAENLDLFHRMRKGEFADGSCVLRAKIDMSHPNVLMRDPLLYRIRHAHHHRTGDKWCIYPMYDYAHPIEDAVEGITHSICTLEFETNRELYDWVLDNTGPWSPRPHQHEFARLALDYTVMSKRKLLQLVNEKRVSGWDDPRMPTIAGMRRRGVTPEALRDFAEIIGVAKNNSIVDISKFELAVRGDLEGRAPRAMAVLNPLKLTLTNWPKDKVEMLDLPWWPGEPERGGSRQVPFGAELLIEKDDFSLEPPKDWKRLAVGREVRLVGACVVRCEEVVRGAGGEVAEVRCSVIEGSLADPKRKASGTIHWVHATRSVPAPVRLYDRLFSAANPDAGGDFLAALNPDSLIKVDGARIEPALAQLEPGKHVQFLRLGYFFTDPVESKKGAPVFNRTMTLRDTWAKPAAAPAPERKPEKPAEARPAAPRKSRSEARDAVRAASPELASRYQSYQQQLGLSTEEADVLTGELELARYFDAAVAAKAPAKAAARWLINDLSGLVKDRSFDGLPLSGATFGRVVAMVEEGKLAAPAAKVLLANLVEKGGDPEQRIRELGLDKKIDAGVIGAALDKVFKAHAAEVERYRAGEKKLLGVLIGATMREVGGAADANAVRKALTDKLG